MITPPTPLEVSTNIENQKKETEARCSPEVTCALCNTSTTDWVTCSKCLRKICSEHINLTRGICIGCTTSMGAENERIITEIKLAELARLALEEGLIAE